MGNVFRVAVPLILYFVLMYVSLTLTGTCLIRTSRWTATFLFIFWLSHKQKKYFGYEMATVQAFTAGSNNFVRVHPLDA